jgi:hypothetical protein
MIESLNNYLGNYYPFFLNNYSLTDQHYLYQLYSPGMSEDFNPYISMIKVSEKTHYGNPGKETDILKACISKSQEGENKLTILEFLEDIFKKDGIVVKTGGSKKFPLIELKEGPEHESLEIPRTLIVNLKDSLRWKFYRFYSGRYLDILWTPTEFALYKIESDNENIWLEPQGLYDNRDVMLQDPLKVPYYKLQTYKWSKNSIKATDLNRFVKKLEWNAFDRRPFSD